MKKRRSKLLPRPPKQEYLLVGLPREEVKLIRTLLLEHGPDPASRRTKAQDIADSLFGKTTLATLVFEKKDKDRRRRAKKATETVMLENMLKASGDQEAQP